MNESVNPAHQALARDPRWFCDVVQPASSGYSYQYTPSEIMQRSPIVVGVYTGDNIAVTRAIAMRDTWLSRLPQDAVYFYSGTPLPHIPAIGLHAQFGPGNPDEVNMVQLLGLADMYQRNPRADWYYIVGDDLYLNVDYALAELQPHSPDELHWVTRSSWYDGAGVPAAFDTTPWINWTESLGKGRKTSEDGAPGTFKWGTGATGWFVSRALARLYAEYLPAFLADPAFERGCHCPDRLTGMIFSLLGVEPTHLPQDRMEAMVAGAIDGSTSVQHVPDLIAHHYVFPMKMYSSDQRAVHEKLDRLLIDGKTDEAMDMFRVFIDAHYATLRHRHSETRHLVELLGRGGAEAAKYRNQRWYDIPADPTVLDEHKL